MNIFAYNSKIKTNTYIKKNCQNVVLNNIFQNY